MAVDGAHRVAIWRRSSGRRAVDLILHGSTAALNTLLEDKGVRVGLITTKGFRDVYEIGRQWRGEDVFNLFAPAPKMLTERRRIHEVGERLDAGGDEIMPLDTAALEQAVAALRVQAVEAIAVAFLFAYTNPAHEREAARVIRALAPDIYVSLSSEVNPEWREYERTASTVANAYIGPPVSRYLQALEALSASRFPHSRTLMMKSDGGAASAAMLSATPIQTVMSGPVAGVIGSRALGDLKGIDNLISFDIGGTSSDMAVIPGRPLFKTEVSVGRHPDPHADRRHRDDRSRRRQHRVDRARRRAQGRSAKRRCPARSRLLRPRRRRRHLDRRARRPRPSQRHRAAGRGDADREGQGLGRRGGRTSPGRSG